MKLNTLFGETEDEFDTSVNKLKNIFDSFKPLYPSYANFLNKIRSEMGDSFVKAFRPFIEKFYFAQEIVQIFQPPPTQYMLKNKKGFYPKIVSFYPFEKVYSDTGKITIYPTTLKEARRRDIQPPDQISNETELPEYIKNIKENKEDRFPKELRFVYSSGKFKKGSKPSDKMSDDLKRRRAQYVFENQNKFSTLLINNAKKLLNAS